MTIGVDLGGSHVLATTVDEKGVIKKRFDIDIEDHAFDAVVRTVVAAVKNVCDQSKEAPAAIGLGSPGNVDPVSGTIRYSPNFGWHDAPLGASLREAFGVPVFIANDARCATLGEHSFG
jgi:glucokinase